ncbi:MAG TPA: response regulator, partial [Tepidisphaeraceae bacterium]|nr:response regulator [Tepidisphaeraceae bacterium]
EGLAAVAKAMNRIDLVLADLHMPEMDGAEMTRRLCADPATKHVPVVICSAEPNAAKIESLMQSGAKGHLRKPFTPEGIRKAITAVLEVARAA